jgi:hypothetical protein
MSNSELTATGELIAYQICAGERMKLSPAPVKRAWMEATESRFAYRCLPLAIANQYGWFVSCPCSFTIRWNGGNRPEDLLIVHDELPPDPMVSSLFGSGILTFNMPCLFRTPSGVNLWVRGPSNWPRDGIYPLEGIVESDWTSATFTMNWMVTRPEQLLRFERGEPICMIVPVARLFIESLIPISRPIVSAPEIHEAFQRWSHNRDDFHERISKEDPAALRDGWQKHYFQGTDPGTPTFNEHQTRLGLRDFCEIPHGI